jgi:hypothetical protein
VYKLVDRARFGNLRAIKLLFSYLLGTPKPVVEPDELDLQELHLAQQTALAAATLQEAAPANSPANDTPPPSEGEVSRPAEGVPEASSPPAAAPSPNRPNGEPCSSTAGEAPSVNRTSNVSEAEKPSQRPSPNRPNGEPAASASNTCPSPNRPNGEPAGGRSKNRPSTNRRKGAGEPGAVCGESPARQAART